MICGKVLTLTFEHDHDTSAEIHAQVIIWEKNESEMREEEKKEGKKKNLR